MADCQNCNYPGTGECSVCHGTGKETDIFEAFAEAISGESQNCAACGGSGKCTSCNGKGYNND